MVIQISDYQLCDHDLICPPHVEMIIQQGSADGEIDICTKGGVIALHMYRVLIISQNKFTFPKVGCISMRVKL